MYSILVLKKVFFCYSLVLFDSKIVDINESQVSYTVCCYSKVFIHEFFYYHNSGVHTMDTGVFMTVVCVCVCVSNVPCLK